MSFTQPQPPHDETRPTTATEQIETSPDIVNDLSTAHVSVSDTPTAPTGEDIARRKQAEDSDDATEVNVLGDQDAVNLAQAGRYPEGSDYPTAQNVRRYPELFDQAVIDSFNVVDEKAGGRAYATYESDETEETVDEQVTLDSDGDAVEVVDESTSDTSDPRDTSTHVTSPAEVEPPSEVDFNTNAESEVVEPAEVEPQAVTSQDFVPPSQGF